MGKYKTYLKLEGNNEDMKCFKQKAKYTYEDDGESVDFLLSQFVETPDELVDACYDESRQHYVFSTPEEVSLKLILALSEQYPSLTFHFSCYHFNYEDVQMADYKVFRCHNGKVGYGVTNRVRVIRCLHCDSIESHERISAALN